VERIRVGLIVKEQRTEINSKVLHENDYTLRPSGTSIVASYAQVMFAKGLQVGTLD
jgi:hypothetical protein